MASSTNSRVFHLRRIGSENCGELKEKTVNISRTAKVVKGGRRFGFSALVVSGDGRGAVGFGLGKSTEVPDALRKAADSARKSLIKVPLKGTTLPHAVVGDSGPTKIILKPAAPGTGVIAGAAVRAVLENAGVKDVRTKIIGSSNPYNVLEAMFDGLLKLRNPQSVAAARNMELEATSYKPF